MILLPSHVIGHLSRFRNTCGVIHCAITPYGLRLTGLLRLKNALWIVFTSSLPSTSLVDAAEIGRDSVERIDVEEEKGSMRFLAVSFKNFSCEMPMSYGFSGLTCFACSTKRSYRFCLEIGSSDGIDQ